MAGLIHCHCIVIIVAIVIAAAAADGQLINYWIGD